MLTKSLAIIFSILFRASVFKKILFKFTQNMKYLELQNISSKKKKKIKIREPEKQDKQANPTAKVDWLKFRMFNKSVNMTLRINRIQVTENNKALSQLTEKG